MHKGFLKAGAICGILSVIIGAFAAHSLRSKVPSDVLNIFETGVRYQMYHSIALILVGILYKEFPLRLMVSAGRFFILGIILFSGSLYLLTYLKAIGNTFLLWIGILTPAGGAAFITGWVLLLIAFYKKRIS